MPSEGFELSFELHPVSEIVPWTNDGAEYLHWFGLTDGEYDLRILGQSIFEYSDAALVHFGLDRRDSTGVRYQVARLFHDLCSTMGDIVDDPIPLDVHRLVDSDTKLARVLRSHKEAIEEPWRAQADVGLTWLFTRTIDSGHLVQGPNVSLWRHNDMVYAWCNSDDRVIDGDKVWAYSPIFASIPVDEFEAEVARFRVALLDAMAARIDAIEQGGQLASNVHRDVVELRAQHATETTTSRLRRTTQPRADWNAVAAALGAM